MGKLDFIRRVADRWLGSYPFLILAAVIIGVLVLVFNLFVPRPEVGVIRISGIILPERIPGLTLEQVTSDEVVQMLTYARDNDSIKAVVLEINSPGGEATATEEIFLSILRLREVKPVVASIDFQAASGGYYIAAASNFIYVKPDSQVGSVGAWVFLPSPERVSENLLPTGPFKITGGSRRKAVGQLDMLKQSFLAAVVTQRGERLNISEKELSRAEVYVGIEGLRYGLIDEIGPNTDAIKKAASYAGIAHYGEVDINQALSLPPSAVDEEKALAIMEALQSRSSLLPVFYYLYIEPK